MFIFEMWVVIVETLKGKLNEQYIGWCKDPFEEIEGEG